MKINKLSTVCITAILISGCIYTPKLVTVYDEECDIEIKHMELEENQLEALTSCTNEDCFAAILGVGVFSAGSEIISGSIVVTANIVYWLEKQSRCH
jgi:hypothetical protein